jgi:hypothetical protein
VWGAHLTSSDTADSVAVSQSNKVSVDDVESSGPQAGHVLPQHPLRSERGDDGDHAGPRPPGIVRSETETSEGHRLAGKPSGDHVDDGTGFGQPPVGGGVDVVMQRHLRVVVGEHGTAERVPLDLTDNGHSRPLQPEVQRGDPGEQRQDVECVEVIGRYRHASAWVGYPCHSTVF